MLCSKTGRLVFLFYQEQHNYIDITSDLKMANSHRQPVCVLCGSHQNLAMRHLFSYPLFKRTDFFVGTFIHFMNVCKSVVLPTFSTSNY